MKNTYITPEVSTIDMKVDKLLLDTSNSPANPGLPVDSKDGSFFDEEDE